MTRETRIAMLVGLLFIIMFGLVISELTGGSTLPATLKARNDRAVAQRYAPVLQVDPPPPGDAPAEALASGGPASPSLGGPGHGTLTIADHPVDSCSVAEVVVVRNETERPAERAPERRPIETIAVAPTPAPALPASTPAPALPPAKKYVVKSRDTLTKIARAEYGPENERLLALIRQANKDALRGGDESLQVGMELVIPPPPAPAVTSRTPSASPAPAAHHDAPSIALSLDELRRAFSPPSSPSSPASSPAPGPTASRAGEELRRALAPAASPAPSPAPSLTASRTGGDPRRGLTPPASPAPSPAPVVLGRSGEELRTPPSTPSPSPAPGAVAGRTTTPDASRYYTIRRGDSLGKIARDKLKDDSQASIRKLYQANRDKLRDPDNLPVGVKLEIPA
jgi:nucleoid-associated protein YgaU